ncbi:MAG: hypothetical protein RMK74_08125 [Myxococcales bacterium]|nr:hypothetical protein [Myxococcales bacterium]
MSDRFVIIAYLATIGVGACGGGTTEPSEPPAPVAGTGGETTGSPWASLDRDGKRRYMADVVVPRMSEVLREHRPGHEDLECADCHGANFQEVDFRMPNGIYPLSVAALQSGQWESEEDAAWARFMAERFKPEMARLLGMPEWTPDNPSGFGCFHCHGQAP